MDCETLATVFRQRFPDLVGAPLVVALSGGGDSVALLLLLHGARDRLGCAPLAAHVHHHLRGADADADAAYCQALCERLGVPLVVEHLVPQRPRGSSPEAWWRRERYRALERARGRLGGAAIATAHTRDDQAETVLLKLLRGSGPRGVAAIRARTGALIRPLLATGRGELRAYLDAAGVAWREDATNRSSGLPRARVRGELLPAMERAFPGSVRHLADFAAALAADEAFLAEALRERGSWPEVGRSVALASAAELPEPLQLRWVLELASRLPLAEPPSRRQLAAVVELLAGRTPAAVDLGRRWVVRRSGDRLVLAPPPLVRFAARLATIGGEDRLPGGFIARIGVPSPAAATHHAWLSKRVLARELAWRSVAAGERFDASPRPIARALAAARIPREWRPAWPVLVADGTMVWLPAVGVAVGWEGGEAEGVLVELEEPWRRPVR